MTDHPTIRAWKDERYRLTLSPEEQASIPPSPAGLIELADADLGEVAGGEEVTNTGICQTSLPCGVIISIAISKNWSCGACDTTIWSGSCAFSSVGCCPAT